MRIVAGRFRGSRLADVGKGDAEAHLRPTTDRVREAVFNRLAHGGFATPPAPEGMRVLDLFAGTGALGLEALSRGAEEVLLVDQGRAARELQRANISRLKVADQVTLLNADATALGPNVFRPFDLVFLDPPYGQGLGEKALENALAKGWLSRSALVVFEDSQEIAQFPHFHCIDSRKYADSWVNFLARA